MNDPTLPCFFESSRDLHTEPNDLAFGETLPEQLIFQAPPDDVLHDDIVDTLLGAEVMNCGNVGVV